MTHRTQTLMLIALIFNKAHGKGCGYKARWRDTYYEIRRDLSPGASVALELWYTLLPVMHVSANLESLWTMYLRDFCLGFLTQVWWMNNPVSSPSPSSEDGGMLKVPSFWSWQVFLMTSPHPQTIREPTQSHLLRTKRIPITQEIASDFGALCQELGADIKCVFLMSQGIPQKLLHFLSVTTRFPSQRPLLRAATLSDSRGHIHCCWDLW